ncbi:MAG: hypothetical protein MZV70_70190 [Desulfobacterales bacterium]|nr:hypothetical protein [Desulfobacterales bacterium]
MRAGGAKGVASHSKSASGAGAPAARDRRYRQAPGPPFAIPDDLPLVPMDDVLIEQVLINLLDNAAKVHAGHDAHRNLGGRSRTAPCAIDGRRSGPGLARRRGRRPRLRQVLPRRKAERRRGAGLGLADLPGIRRGARRPDLGRPTDPKAAPSFGSPSR